MNNLKQRPIGAMDQLLILQKPVFSPDNMGGQTVTWQDQATLWAYIKPTRQSSNIDADGRHNQNFYEIRVRQRDDLQTGQRFIWGDRVLNILTIENTGRRNLYITLTAREAARL